MQDGTYISKVTAPVKVINPSKKTQLALLKAELKRRIGAIQEVCEADRYGQVQVYMIDPYSIRRILDVVEGRFVNVQYNKEGKMICNLR